MNDLREQGNTIRELSKTLIDEDFPENCKDLEEFVIKKSKKGSANQLKGLQKAGTPSHNPSGKPKGTRNYLSKRFIEELSQEFETNYDIILAELRKNPVKFCEIVSRLVPQQVEIGEINQFSDMSDAELQKYIKSTQAELKEI